jgi:AcrR family transcriptional regulator
MSTPSARARKRPGPPGGVRDENRKRRVAALLDAALRLFLRHGVEVVTIDDITARARMAKGGFYRYFDDKDALVRALVAPLAETIERAFARCSAELAAARTLDGIAAGYMTLAADLARAVLEQSDVVRFYLQECRGPAAGPRRPVSRLAARILELSIGVTRVAVERRLMRPFSAEIITLAVIGATEAMIHAHLSGAGLAPAAGVAPALIDLFLHGVAARPS